MADARRFLSSTSFGRTSEEWAPSAFEFSHGKPMWKVLEEEPDQRHNFELWMRERRKHKEYLWHRRYPPCASPSSANLKIDPEAVLMVDIGGANGSQALDFKAQFPHLPGRYVVQDLYLPKPDEASKPSEGVKLMSWKAASRKPGVLLSIMNGPSRGKQPCGSPREMSPCQFHCLLDTRQEAECIENGLQRSARR